jgi:hypothetical protein
MHQSGPAQSTAVAEPWLSMPFATLRLPAGQYWTWVPPPPILSPMVIVPVWTARCTSEPPSILSSIVMPRQARKSTTLCLPTVGAIVQRVQVRHRGTPIAAEIHIEADPAADRATVQLAEPTVAAPGKAAVIYESDRVLAGGWVAR